MIRSVHLHLHHVGLSGTQVELQDICCFLRSCDSVCLQLQEEEEVAADEQEQEEVLSQTAPKFNVPQALR